jgi:hypothetical protein
MEVIIGEKDKKTEGAGGEEVEGREKWKSLKIV